MYRFTPPLLLLFFLLLQTLFAASTPPAIAQGQGIMVGLITDATTGNRLAGVTVSVSGQTTLTNANGFYRVDNVPIGSQIALATMNGYAAGQKARLIIANQVIWNSLTLSPSTRAPTPTPTPTAAPVSQTGVLIGLITDIETRERLTGVVVSVAGQTTLTNERGLYQFNNVPAGQQNVTAENEGYEPAQKTRQVIANEVRWNSIKLTKQFSGCPTTSDAEFELIPILNSSDDHPDVLHGDLNFSQRGYSPTSANLTLQDYAGGVDVNAPQLSGLFQPTQFPGISQAYRASHWDWGCGEHGCRGNPITDWPVTVIGLATTPGQTIYPPDRLPEILPRGFKALVLYAEERRITLGYTRDDTVATGYAVHLENVCVDPNLLSLYRAQNNAFGFRATGWLPALRQDQSLGITDSNEIQVAIRDRGAFMDPRSRKDWWQGY